MSRPKPYTPTAVQTATAVTGPATCGDCRHWRVRDGINYGLCVVAPPSVPGAVTPIGPLCHYPVTTSDCTACAKAEAK